MSIEQSVNDGSMIAVIDARVCAPSHVTSKSF